MRRLALVTCLVLAACSNNNAPTTLIDRWYAALSTVNRAEFAALLGDDAKITLDDLSITQTKAEFIVSLDEWEGANKGATIRHSVSRLIEHTLKSGTGTILSILVCYKFPSNEMLTQEDFAVEGDKIISSEQKTIADSCATFPK
jgi:hypothetical protein